MDFQNEPIESEIKIDTKGLKILYELINNPRISLNEIAKSVNLSRNSIEYRIKQFELKGVITGYKAIINTRKLGYKKYLLYLNINPNTKEKKFTSKILNSNEINMITTHKGKFNYEIAILVKDETTLLDIYYKLFNDVISCDKEVLIMIKTIKSQVLPPKYFKKDIIKQSITKKLEKKEKNYSIDDEDIKIMQILGNNANLTNVEVGNKINLNHDTVRYKVNKLISSNYIKDFKPLLNYRKLNLNTKTILIKLNNSAYNKTKKIDKFLKENDNIIKAIKCFGKYDYSIIILSINSQEIITFFDEIKNNFGDIINNYDILIRDKQLKYSYMITENN